MTVVESTHDDKLATRERNLDTFISVWLQGSSNVGSRRDWNSGSLWTCLLGWGVSVDSIAAIFEHCATLPPSTALWATDQGLEDRGRRRHGGESVIAWSRENRSGEACKSSCFGQLEARDDHTRVLYTRTFEFVFAMVYMHCVTSNSN